MAISITPVTIASFFLTDAWITSSRSNQNLMFRVNVDRFFDDNPQDAVGGTNAPSVARRYSRRSWTAQVNHTAVINPRLLNEARFAYLHGDPVTLWEAQNLSTTYTRGGAVPFTIGQSRASDLWGHQVQFSDTVSWSLGKHYLRFGGSVIHHTSGGTGSEPGTAILGTFTFKNTTTAPFGQLTLRRAELHAADQLRHQQLRVAAVAHTPASCRTTFTCAAISRSTSDCAMTARHLTDANEQLRAAHRFWLASGRRFAHVDSRRLRDVLHADPYRMRSPVISSTGSMD